jgi:hypothetical protein
MLSPLAIYPESKRARPGGKSINSTLDACPGGWYLTANVQAFQNRPGGMSLLTHLIHLGVKELDRGVCIVWRCPRCEVPRDYRLIQSRGNVCFLGLEFSRPAIMMDLRCSVCGYEMRVDPSEEPLLVQAAEATHLLKIGSVSTQAYQDRVRSLPARFIGGLKALNETWKCSNCGEDNPVTFDSCWNCRRSNEARSPDLVAGEQTPVRPLPGGNPWENM